MKTDLEGIKINDVGVGDRLCASYQNKMAAIWFGFTFVSGVT